MPPRVNRCLLSSSQCLLRRGRCAATATMALLSSHDQTVYPSTQPPSYKSPKFRKSQLIRQYVSLLRSTPLMLLFQHNNIMANEWVVLRRELAHALRKVDERLPQSTTAAGEVSEAEEIKLLTIRTEIFTAALRIVEYYRPTNPSDNSMDPQFTHALSRDAHDAVLSKKSQHPLAPLLAGPITVLTFPSVSPPHLAAALSILSPSKAFPAPTRREREKYHDPKVIAAVEKLLLLGARIEGKVFDDEEIRYVGGIEGGLMGLRAKMVGMLEGIGGTLVAALQGTSRALYFTVEGRKTMLAEQDVHDKTP